jgi:hypothetical protein
MSSALATPSIGEQIAVDVPAIIAPNEFEAIGEQHRSRDLRAIAPRGSPVVKAKDASRGTSSCSLTHSPAVSITADAGLRAKSAAFWSQVETSQSAADAASRPTPINPGEEPPAGAPEQSGSCPHGRFSYHKLCCRALLRRSTAKITPQIRKRCRSPNRSCPQEWCS